MDQVSHESMVVTVIPRASSWATSSSKNGQHESHTLIATLYFSQSTYAASVKYIVYN